MCVDWACSLLCSSIFTPSHPYAPPPHPLISLCPCHLATPIFSLDYDIFIVSRVLEFRNAGWSDRMSVCWAVEKTGGVITAAGLIMFISFIGLLIPQTIVLNQYGFALAVGVAIDTFYVRPILVPALMATLGSNGCSCFRSCCGAGNAGSSETESSFDINWWPRKVPRVRLSPEAEREAAFAGIDELPSSSAALSSK